MKPRLGLDEARGALCVGHGCGHLAAGDGSQFLVGRGGPDHKWLAPWRSRPLVTRAVATALDARIGPVWVVAGAVELDAVLPAQVEVLVEFIDGTILEVTGRAEGALNRVAALAKESGVWLERA